MKTLSIQVAAPCRSLRKLLLAATIGMTPLFGLAQSQSEIRTYLQNFTQTEQKRIQAGKDDPVIKDIKFHNNELTINTQLAEKAADLDLLTMAMKFDPLKQKILSMLFSQSPYAKRNGIDLLNIAQVKCNFIVGNDKSSETRTVSYDPRLSAGEKAAELKAASQQFIQFFVNQSGKDKPQDMAIELKDNNIRLINSKVKASSVEVLNSLSPKRQTKMMKRLYKTLCKKKYDIKYLDKLSNIIEYSGYGLQMVYRNPETNTEGTYTLTPEQIKEINR